MDLRAYRREFLTEFINCFRENECLWLYTSRDYKKTNFKMLAYEKLLKIYQKYDPNCTIAEVKKTIQSLRASHRKERKKILGSLRTGSGTDEVYNPKLWYYTKLEFLNDQIESSPSFSNLDQDQADDTNSTMQSPLMEHTGTSVSSLAATSSSQQSSTQAQSGHKKKSDKENRENIMETISKRLKHPEDEFDVVGKNVANKLRVMDHQQRILSEKLINDTLYYGTVQHLTFDSHISGNTCRTNVVERPFPCSTPFPILPTHAQSQFVHDNYSSNNTNSKFSFVPNNNNATPYYSQLHPLNYQNTYATCTGTLINQPKIITTNARNPVIYQNTYAPRTKSLIPQCETITLNVADSLQSVVLIPRSDTTSQRSPEPNAQDYIENFTPE